MAIRKFIGSSLSNPNTKSSKIWDGQTFSGNYDCISSVTLDSSGGGIQFANIPQNYTHLELRYVARCISTDSTNGVMSIRITFNSVGTNTYDYTVMKGVGNATTVASGEINKTNGPIVGLIAGNGIGSGYFSSGVIEILDYTNTNKNKVTRSVTGCEVSGTLSEVAIYGGLWRSTAAITTIDLAADGGGFGRYTNVALYGVKV